MWKFKRVKNNKHYHVAVYFTTSRYLESAWNFDRIPSLLLYVRNVPLLGSELYKGKVP